MKSKLPQHKLKLGVNLYITISQCQLLLNGRFNGFSPWMSRFCNAIICSTHTPTHKHMQLRKNKCDIINRDEINTNP